MRRSSWLLLRSSFILIVAALAVPCHSMESETLCSNQFQSCKELHQNQPSEMEDRCRNWLEVIHCVDQYFLHSCASNGLILGFYKNSAITNYCTNNCSSAPTEEECRNMVFPPPTPPPEPTVPSNCSSLPSAASPEPLGDPSLTFPPPSSSECTLPSYLTHYRQHCSVFSLSHVRPFGDRSLPVDTCYLPGKWYLFKHQNLTVVIEGTHAEASGAYDYTYTYISKVNVTFYNHSCFEHTVSYQADASLLPTYFTSQSPEPTFPNETVATSLDSLQLTVSNQTVATLLAPWLNVSIIIHRVAGYLSMTLQVPEPLSRQNEVGGLCSTGCPPDTIQNTSLPNYQCPTDKLSAGLICLDIEAVRQLFDSLETQDRSISYTPLCQYDLVLTHNLSLVSLYQALAKDALKLPDLTTFTTPTGTRPDSTPPTSPGTKPTLPPVGGSLHLATATADAFMSGALSLNPTSLFITFTMTLLIFYLR